MRCDRVARLLAGDSSFVRAGAEVELRAEGFAGRSAAIGSLVAQLAAEDSLVPTGEMYPLVAAFGDEALLQLDRGAVPWLGVRPFGVHLCAFVRQQGQLFVWVAVRAAGRTFAGQWDNTVAGGQPIGLSVAENLQKECAEEAGIPAALAARAVPVATLTYVRSDPSGLKPDTLFCHDLELPDAFVPRPHDGEVERFLRLPAREIAAVVRDSRRCKPNCSLVWIDFLLRHGLLDDELAATARADLVARLRARLP